MSVGTGFSIEAARHCTSVRESAARATGRAIGPSSKSPANAVKRRIADAIPDITTQVESEQVRGESQSEPSALKKQPQTKHVEATFLSVHGHKARVSRVPKIKTELQTHSEHGKAIGARGAIGHAGERTRNI
jgi:hypothetical protein